MKKGLTEVVCIIDKSGSMGMIKEKTIDGFNKFLNYQQELTGDANLTLVLFDTGYEQICLSKAIKEVNLLNEDTYSPNGGTALLDAIGRTINEVGRRLKETEESLRPEKVIFSIMTDGEENASKLFSFKDIDTMIKHQREVYSWEFIFLAANIDKAATANKMGIAAHQAIDFSATDKGVTEAFNKVCEAISCYRMKE